MDAFEATGFETKGRIDATSAVVVTTQRHASGTCWGSGHWRRGSGTHRETSIGEAPQRIPFGHQQEKKAA